MASLLSLEKLCVAVHNKPIISNLNLTIKQGELHVLLGPNGGGKSSLVHALAGKPHYEVTAGHMFLLGKDMAAMSPEERAHAGLFVGFQHSVIIPGVNNVQFLKTAINEKRKASGKEARKHTTLLHDIKQAQKRVQLDGSFLHRSVNDGFSGGEKKRSELMHMVLLEPKLVVLDEIDSGLDVPGRQLMASMIDSEQKKGVAFLIITHYEDFLKHTTPDGCHIMRKGRLHSGSIALAKEILHQR